MKRCDACRVEFEPKTPIVSADKLQRHNIYHAGCWAKINKAIIVKPTPKELYINLP